MTAELAVEAVKNACLNVKDTSGIILHSDLGASTLVWHLKITWLKGEFYILSAAREILMTMPALNLFIQC